MIRLLPAHAGDLTAPSAWLERGIADAAAPDFPVTLADILTQVTAVDRSPAWGAFWAIRSIGGQDRAVGLCAFKDEPRNGEVEIAYFTFPHRERTGVATDMARTLTAAALPLVKTVVAQTLPANNASCTVLRRCGFVWAGDAIDPEDGPVWRWEYPGEAARGA